jgi:SnoaL-like domain
VATLLGMTPPALAAWHDIVDARDPAGLADLLAGDATFHSPILYRPQAGRDLVTMYLTGALQVLGNETFTYVREVVGPHDAVLEFEATVDGVVVNGVDMLRWDEHDRIVDFTVMLRPLRAVNLVHARMADLLQATSAPVQGSSE